ncbi:hypothetical protein K458DRAFT_491307 [Lentithecium fluviatile CBS 122367]|uniref:Fungal N-terminal domain-containing protein n=1 Tax=Lentithecium fluviatile CBS 122367 TaxID=1168545 RepID=A0A6G1IJ29_9PLEO|nr:hypothetical protein K458DRAFT_491307 [Lentithecium fluviatile CBS 122367]
MDPLSVAASIVGILTAAAKVAEIVQPFVSNTKSAPRLAVQIANEVNSIRIVLSSLKLVLQELLTPSAHSASRASHVQVDHIVVLFTDGVLLFSELEALLAPLRAPENRASQLQFRQRVLWATKKNDISAVISRMQLFLASLSGLLNIFQCRSDIAVIESQQKLESQIATLLCTNEILAQKVRELEDKFHAVSLAPIGNGRSDRITSRTAQSGLLSTVPSLDNLFSRLRLEEDLDDSRVYRRVKRVESRTSFSTSCFGSVAWSVFSGLSLADISIVAAIALPLYRCDIQNPDHYTFGEYQSEPQEVVNSLYPSNKELATTRDSLTTIVAEWEHHQLDSKKLILFGSLEVTVTQKQFNVRLAASKNQTQTQLYLFEKDLLVCQNAYLTTRGGQKVFVLAHIDEIWGITCFDGRPTDDCNLLIKLKRLPITIRIRFENEALMERWASAIMELLPTFGSSGAKKWNNDIRFSEVAFLEDHSDALYKDLDKPSQGSEDI